MTTNGVCIYKPPLPKHMYTNYQDAPFYLKLYPLPLTVARNSEIKLISVVFFAGKGALQWT